MKVLGLLIFATLLSGALFTISSPVGGQNSVTGSTAVPTGETQPQPTLAPTPAQAPKLPAAELSRRLVQLDGLSPAPSNQSKGAPADKVTKVPDDGPANLPLNCPLGVDPKSCLATSEPTTLRVSPESLTDKGSGFGRHGPLTPREYSMAQTAWAYFVERYQPDTGLVNAVGEYPSATLWDTASYISGLVSAYELGIIDKRTFDGRIYLLIRTLRRLDLFRGEAPNKVYNTKTGAKVNYANQPGEIGFSALDIGRLLIWLDILKQRYPYLAAGIDNIPLRWSFCNLVQPDGSLDGSIVSGKGETRYVQEGRLGYEEYAAKGFALWGFDVSKAMGPQPLAYTEIYGVKVPYDSRDPRVFHNQNYVLTEGYLLDGIELGWNMPGDVENSPGVASQGWRVEFANRIYQVQQRRFEMTGILTARSEHQVEGTPYFVYDSIFADGYAWNTLDPSDVYQPDRAAVSAKAAIGMWALWSTPYTDLLFESVADLSTSVGGFYEGFYENGDGFIPLQTANNNGIILAALLYKVQGPILQRRNLNTQYWDVAFSDTDIRENRCLPLPVAEEANFPTSASPAPAAPPLPAQDFMICRPINRADDTELGATDCHPEAQDPLHPQSVPRLPQSDQQSGNSVP